MSDIHPTAIIGDGANIGSDCKIGPYSVIGSDVEMGNGCHIHAHVVLDGKMILGDDNEIFSFACLGKKTQDLKYKGGQPAVHIGSRNVIREYVTINAATYDGDATVLGDDCLIQSYVHIAHDCILANNIIVSSGSMMAGHCIVEDHAIISGYCGITQFIRIGRHSFLGGYSKLAQDLLPYSIGEGGPAEIRTVNKVGMQRRGYSDVQIRCAHKAIRKLLDSGLTIEDAIAELENEFPDSKEVAEIIAFANGTKQGLARPRKK